MNVCRDIARFKEAHMWETGKLTSTPGIHHIMPRNEYERIKSVLTFQRQNEDGSTDKLAMFHWTLDQSVINVCVIYCRENNVEKPGF